MNVTILGAGSWGTAVATLLAANGHAVKIWCFEETVFDDIVTYRLNKTYFPGVELSKKIVPTTSIQEAVQDAEIIFEAVPMLFLRSVLEEAKPFLTDKQLWVVLSKGIENKTYFFPSQVIDNVVEHRVPVAIVSGPNLAYQVATQQISGMVVASKDATLAQQVMAVLANDYCLPYASSDIMGVQIGAALKNVIALFLGIIDGSGYKENTLALLVTQGLAEIVELAKFYGGKPETIYGLAGLGDLVLGLLGEKSRNYKIGMLFGKGNDLADVSNMIPVLPEGVTTSKALYHLLETNNLNLPLCRGVYQIIHEGKSIRTFIKEFVKTSLTV